MTRRGLFSLKRRRMLNRIAAYLIFCLVAHVAAGQSRILPHQPLLERLIGSSGQEEFRSAVVNWRGDIAAVGNASPGKEGGQDILLAIFDAQLNLLTERYIGRPADDGVHQINVLPDGRYVIAGYSVKPSTRSRLYTQYIGQRDGWLLILDERGNTEQEMIRGTMSQDEFVVVLAGNDGTLWVAGNTSSSAWVLRLSPTLEVLWEQRVQYHHLSTKVITAYLTEQEELWLIGTVEEAGRQQMWVAAFDRKGQQVMEKVYPHSLAQQGVAIRSLSADRFLLVANGHTGANREQGVLCVLSTKGEHLHYLSVGGREFDQLNAAIMLSNGRILAGGSSTSYERGSRRLSAWVVALEQELLTLKELQTRYYGSKFNDELYALLEHPDGRVLAFGTTSRQVLRQRQAWFFQLSPRVEKKSKIESLSFRLQSPVYPNAKNFLLEKERLFFPVRIENTSREEVHNLFAHVSTSDPKQEKYLRIPSIYKIQFPALAGGAFCQSAIPISFNEGTPPGAYTLRIQFFQGTTPVGELHTCTIRVGKRLLPSLLLSVRPPDTALTLGSTGHLQVRIENNGDLEALQLSLRTKPSEGLLSPAVISLGNLPPGTHRSYNLPITPQWLSESSDTSLNLQLYVVDSALSCSAVASVSILVKVPAPITFRREEPQKPLLIWVYPNPDNFDRNEIRWTQQEITVQIKIVAAQPPKRQHFCVEVNGQPCVSGVKMDEVRIRGERNSWTLTQTVRLQEGKNILRPIYNDSIGSATTDSLVIWYTPSRSSLHVLAIGVPSPDLKYTIKDARDFSRALAQSSNTAFEQIFVDTLITEEATTKTEILKALRRLHYRYDALQLLPKDILVLFLSAHGLTAYDGGFRIAASDYDGPFLRETSLDFEQEILNYLQVLPCRKVVFVDACQSGKASSATLADIVARKSNMEIMVSCLPDEYSYEDDSWQNGAFTRALVAGIQAFSKEPTLLDKNRDNMLDVNELFAFVQKEVPILVEKKRPRPKSSQRPHLTSNNVQTPTILFGRSKIH